MVNEHYQKMLGAKNRIRVLAEFATKRKREVGEENVFDFSLGNPSLPVPREFTQEMIRLLQSEDSLTLHGYSPTLGNPLFKEKIAESLNRRFGMTYTENHIFPTTGAAGALAHALRAVTKPGDEVLVFAPFFSEYAPYVEGAGCKLRVVPADEETFQINFPALEQMLTENVAALLINSPNNPSGVVYSEETLKKLAGILEEKEEEYGKDLFLISDEPYREILFDKASFPYISKFYKNTLSCYSYAKSMSIPGERLGYVAVNPACKDAEQIVPMCGQISRGLGHNCPPSLIQIAVARTCEALSDLQVYERNRNLIYETLMDLGFTCVKPGGTFYIFPKALTEDAETFCRAALQYDLILVPSDGFGVPGFFRMAYCTGEEKVARAMVRFREFVEKEYPNR